MSGMSNARVREFRSAADQALANEKITRERVDNIEQWAMVFTRLSFWGRLRWLFLGR